MANNSAGAIKLFVLGDARIETPTAVIEPTAEIVFALSLFFLIRKKGSVGRTTLQQMLWPHVPVALASHRLRQTLLKARRLGLPIEASGKAGLSFIGTEVTRDYERVLAAPSSDKYLESFSLELLPAFEPTFSRPYSEWLDSWKLEVSGPIVGIVLGLIASARLQGHWSVVEAQSKRLLQVAPFNEEATLAVAESLAMRGEKLEAVRTLDNYLSEIGRGPSDLRVSADVMRRRIADRTSPRHHNVPLDIPLLAREGMMEHLSKQMREAQCGRGQACVVWGDPGIGKSRLLTEFLEFSALQGFVSQRIYCRSSDSGRPLAVLLELIPTLRSMRGAIGAAPETLAYLDTLTKHRPNRNTSVELGRPDETSHAYLDHALVDLLGAIADESPFVLAMEDCHWMDPASATVLSQIASRLVEQSIFMIFTSRGFADGPLEPLSTDVDQISVPPLSDADSAELVQHIVRQRGQHVSSKYAEWCAKVAEGNPYFLQELSNHLLETRDEHGAPPSLTAVLRQRLARLSPDALQLLQTCALLENHSTLDVIEDVLGYEGHRLLQAINEVAVAGMLASDSSKGIPSAANRLNSRHDLLSETALMQLAPPTRSYLHRRAAKVLEKAIDRHGDVSTLWSCAKHWQLAGDPQHALRLAKSCATHLLQAGLPHDASEAFDRALAYCSDDAETLSILEQQAAAFYSCTAWQRVAETVARARALKHRLEPNAHNHDDLELMVLRASWQELNWNEIICKALVCLSAREATVAHRVEAGVMALMTMSHYGDPDKARNTFESIIDVSRSQNDVPITLLLQARMVFHTNWGTFDEAVIAARVLVVQQQRFGNVGAVFRSMCNASVTYRTAGLLDEARTILSDALAIADRHQLHVAKPRALIILANLSLETGRISEAKHSLELLESTPIGLDDHFCQLETRTIGARIALLEGRANDAHLLLEDYLAEPRANEPPHRRAYDAALRIAIDLGMGEIPSAATLKELRDAHYLTRANTFQAFPAFALFAGLRVAGDIAEAGQILREYLHVHRREAWPAPVQLLTALVGECLDLAELGLASTQQVDG